MEFFKSLFKKHGLSKTKEVMEVFKTHQIEGVNYQFGEAALADGTAVMFPSDVITIGEPVYVVTEQGELPAPEGEHTLSDGTVIVVEGMEGIVAEIRPAEAPAEESEPAPAEAPVVDEEQDAERSAKRIIESIVKESVFAKQDELEALKAENAELKSKLDAFTNLLEENNKLMEGLTEAVAKFAKQPEKQPAAVSRFGKTKKSENVAFNILRSIKK